MTTLVGQQTNIGFLAFVILQRAVTTEVVECVVKVEQGVPKTLSEQNIDRVRCFLGQARRYFTLKEALRAGGFRIAPITWAVVTEKLQRSLWKTIGGGAAQQGFAD